MAENTSFSRLLIINGQPILIKNDSGLVDLSSFQSLSSDILQQAIDDATPDESIPAVLENTNETILMSDENNISVVSNENEYVTVVSNGQSSDDGATIRLTLEQAAELGLTFSVDNEENLGLFELNSGGLKDVAVESRASQFSTTTSENPNCTEGISKLNITEVKSDIPNNLTEELHTVDKCEETTPFLDQFQSLDSSQQFSLVPQIINGTVTYTLQLCNETSNQTNNPYFDINETPVIDQNSTESATTADLTNISSVSNIPYINSKVSHMSNEADCAMNDSVNISKSRIDTVSTDDVPVTFLNLSEQIPIGTSVSNIASHINHSLQSKLFTIEMNSSLDAPTKQSPLKRQSFNSSSTDHNFVHPIAVVSKTDSSQTGLSNKNNLSSKSAILKLKNKTSGPTKPLILERANKTNLASLLHVNNIQEDTSKKNERSILKEQLDHETSSDFLVISAKNNQYISKDSMLFKKGDDDQVSHNEVRRSVPTIITPNGGDIPEEVSHVLSHIPIKNDRNKPLGSNENPIKLVQQGHTFHSSQALTEEDISKLKPILNEKFDSKVSSKNVVYDPVSKTRIIYRIISPEEVSLRKQEEFPRKRGRPKKVRSTDEGPLEEIAEGAPAPKKIFPRTRSGRLSRPPKHMVRDYKHLRRAEIDDSDGAYSDYQSEQEDDPSAVPESAPVDLLPGLTAKRKSQKRNISAGNLCPSCGKVYLGYVRMKMHFERYPDHGSIEYLNTVRNSNPDSEAENNKSDGGTGLWKSRTGKKRRKGKHGFLPLNKRSRLKEVLGWCGGKDIAEVAGPAVASVLSLWELLMLRVDCTQRHSRVLTLYQELCQLLHKLQSVAHRLFRPVNCPADGNVTVKIEDEVMTKVLNLPSGLYLASDEDLNQISTPTVQEVHPQEHEVTPPSIQLEKTPEESVQSSKSKLDMNEVSQPFLLSGEEIICDTDERSLVNVDEIVSERLENFSGSQSSSVDELMKGLNELEQRNKLGADDLMDDFSIVTQSNHVSASTEDLMKSLEHFDSGLAHTDSTGSLDRDTFDRVTNVDTLDFEVLSREFHSNNR